jgi:hypothetical protein
MVKLSIFHCLIFMNSYSDDWGAIATVVKQLSGYECQRCRLKCLPPVCSYRHLPKHIRFKLVAQVHHIDWDPSNNDPNNLICLCTACHLKSYRHSIRPIAGQLSFKLKLLKQKNKMIQYSQNFQLSLEDLIDLLPKRINNCQLELDFD